MRFWRLLLFFVIGVVEPLDFGPFSLPNVGWRTGNYAFSKLTGRSLALTTTSTQTRIGEIKRRKDKRKEKKVKGEKKKKEKKEKVKKVKGEKKKKEKKVSQTLYQCLSIRISLAVRRNGTEREIVPYC